MSSPLVVTLLSLLAMHSALVSSQYFGTYQCRNGSDVFVHLFEWKWTDVARECEQFLAPAGYCAVQVGVETKKEK